MESSRKKESENMSETNHKSERVKSKGYKGYNDGLQPGTLADGNWLVNQNHQKD